MKRAGRAAVSRKAPDSPPAEIAVRIGAFDIQRPVAETRQTAGIGSDGRIRRDYGGGETVQNGQCGIIRRAGLFFHRSHQSARIGRAGNAFRVRQRFFRFVVEKQGDGAVFQFCRAVQENFSRDSSGGIAVDRAVDKGDIFQVRTIERAEKPGGIVRSARLCGQIGNAFSAAVVCGQFFVCHRLPRHRRPVAAVQTAEIIQRTAGFRAVRVDFRPTAGSIGAEINRSGLQRGKRGG